MLKLTLITIFLAGCQIYEGEAFFGLDGYSKLNDHLVDKVHSTDLAENVGEALAIINSDASSSLKKAATLFVSLAETAGKCDQASYEALRKNVEATKGAAQSRRPPTKRIDNLIYQYAIQHSVECPAVYAEQYLARWSRMDPKLRDQLGVISEDMSSALITQRSENLWDYPINNEQDIFDEETNIYNIGDRIDEDENFEHFSSAVLKIIKRSGKGDPDVVYASPQVNEKKGETYAESKKLTELYDKYLLQPCKAHAEKTADLYEAANFDFKMNDDPYSNKDGPGEAMVAFKRGWTLSRVCNHILKKISKPLLNAVIKSASY